MNVPMNIYIYRHALTGNASCLQTFRGQIISGNLIPRFCAAADTAYYLSAAATKKKKALSPAMIAKKALLASSSPPSSTRNGSNTDNENGGSKYLYLANTKLYRFKAKHPKPFSAANKLKARSILRRGVAYWLGDTDPKFDPLNPLR